MGNFWTQRLSQPPATQVQVVTPVVQPQFPQTQQAQQPYQMVAAPPQPGEAHFGELIAQQDYVPRKAQSAKYTDLCPDCDSPNLLRATPNSLLQCFNCGWNERFLHSTHGIGSTGGKNEGPVRTARGQTLATNNWNPQTIVGRVN